MAAAVLRRRTSKRFLLVDETVHAWTAMSCSRWSLVRLIMILLVAAAQAGACTPYELEPLPLEVSIEAEAGARTPGAEVSFVVRAQGGSLLGVIVDFGDDETQAVAMYGARTGRTVVKHTYASAGTYEVRAEVEDATAGLRSASVLVEIR